MFFKRRLPVATYMEDDNPEGMEPTKMKMKVISEGMETTREPVKRLMVTVEKTKVGMTMFGRG